MLAHLFHAVIGLASTTTGESSTVSGRVTLGGPRPPVDAAWVTRGGGCPQLIPDDRLAVREDGSLRDSVVSLLPDRGTRLPAAATAALAPREAEVRGLYCSLSPRVQAVRPGSLLVVAEEPRSGHRFHAYRDGNSLFGGTLESGAPRVLREPGVVDVRCDAGHEWEVSWVYVTDAPFVAVTDAEGRFALEGVPAGRYTLRAWHPYLGQVNAPIRVDPAAPSGLVVSFSGRAAVESLYPETTLAVP